MLDLLERLLDLPELSHHHGGVLLLFCELLLQLLVLCPGLGVSLLQRLVCPKRPFLSF